MDCVVEVTGELGHPVRIRSGLLDRAGERCIAQGIAPGARVLLVIDRAVRSPHAERLQAGLESAGFRVATVELLADERAKTIDAVTAIWQAALAARLGRSDAMIALGGGLIGDVAGFAAASYLRGVRLIQAPTTLLAMVDASTGGKTGINLRLPEEAGAIGGSLGKNLAGAFWPPLEVLIDPLTLETLPRRERSSGLAECVKHAIIDGEDHLRFLESRVERVLELERDSVEELISRSVRVKGAIVSRDPRERGERAVLNLGHTFAHAIETLPDVDLRHGEAVAIGLVAALRLAEHLGEGTPGLLARVARLLERCGLPTRLPKGVDSDLVLERMDFDKKTERGALRLVIPRSLAQIDAGRALSRIEVAKGLAE